jgi:hypothetical protein
MDRYRKDINKIHFLRLLNYYCSTYPLLSLLLRATR